MTDLFRGTQKKRLLLLFLLFFPPDFISIIPHLLNNYFITPCSSAQFICDMCWLVPLTQSTLCGPLLLTKTKHVNYKEWVLGPLCYPHNDIYCQRFRGGLTVCWQRCQNNWIGSCVSAARLVSRGVREMLPAVWLYLCLSLCVSTQGGSSAFPLGPNAFNRVYPRLRQPDWEQCGTWGVNSKPEKRQIFHV